MSEVWVDINTAPKDGTVIYVRRLFYGRLIYEGQACWRTVRFPALPVDGPPYDVTGWMYPTIPKRVPEPTHWRPRGEPR